jgi:hypothetical protein
MSDLEKVFLPLGVAILIAPRLGLGRAAYLAVRSLMTPMNGPMTAHRSQLELLRSKLRLGDWKKKYIAVTGPLGVGKTCLIKSATHRCAGVVKVEIMSGLSEDKVKAVVMRQVANTPFIHNLESHFRRVIFWHRMVTLGKSPVVTTV